MVERLTQHIGIVAVWKSHATLTLLAKQDLPTFGYNMIDPLKSWCWGSFYFTLLKFPVFLDLNFRILSPYNSMV